MKAVFRFQDGGILLLRISPSNDSLGNVYVREFFTLWVPEQGKVRFEFQGVKIRAGQEVSEYRELAS